MFFLTCQKNSTSKPMYYKAMYYYIVQNNKPYYQNCTERAYETEVSFSNLIYDCSMSLLVHLWLSLSFLYFKLCLSYSPVWVNPLTSSSYGLLLQGPLNWLPDTTSWFNTLSLLLQGSDISFLSTSTFTVQIHLISDLFRKSCSFIFVPRGICSKLSYFNEEC